MSKRIFLVMVITIATLLVSNNGRVALAHTPSPPVCNDPTCNIDINDYSFTPNLVTIRPPNTTSGEYVQIVFFNHGGTLHSVTSGSSGSPDGLFDYDVSPGTSLTLNVTETLYNQIIAKYSTGAVPYYCKYHLSFGMTATMNVAGTPIPEFSPATLLLTIALVSVFLLTVLRSKARGFRSHGST